MKSVLVTGATGLVGSECVAYFDQIGWRAHGVDNNMRMAFFGPDGDTSWNRKRLHDSCTNFEHHDIDIRDRDRVLALVKDIRPQLLIHCAAQASHDLARDRPFDDFEINATGTLNLLEAVRLQLTVGSRPRKILATVWVAGFSYARVRAEPVRSAARRLGSGSRIHPRLQRCKQSRYSEQASP